jgi:acyl-CoA hydrolase
VSAAERPDLIGLRRRAFRTVGDLGPRPPSASRTVIIQPMEIVHASNAGFVHGGSIMRLVDTAGGIAAMRHCGGPVVTASMDEMSFLAPVHIGDLLTVRAQVNDSGRTSMEVGVRVEVEMFPGGESVHVSSAYLVFVALDQERHPVPVPPLVPETDEERRRQAQARIRREQRLLRKEALRRAGEPRVEPRQS